MALVSVLLLFGTAGYWWLGLTPFDALYQTVITITTVGYQEVAGDEPIGSAYRGFTMFLVLFGTGSVLYTLGVLVESLLEGSLNDEMRRRRMMKTVSEFEGHVVVVGWGRVGQAIAHYMTRFGRDVVIIDSDNEITDAPHPLIRGDATDDTVLLQAGVTKASVLVAALNHDADNLFVTLSARALKPNLFIVVRTGEQANESKFFQAGADRVVNPHEIGGSRMAALALQPHVAEFLDEVLHDEGHDAALHEVAVLAGSPMVGRPLVDLHSDAGSRALIIAIKAESGAYHTNPPPQTVLTTGDVLIALGSRQQLSALRSLIR
ncbi:MAG: potassium channel protein [Acidimicrobiales bacterium]